MDIDELLALLDIGSPDELVYFEQFADLMEMPRDIPPETLAELVEGMEAEVLSDLVSGYFEDILTAVPDGEDELYTLLTNIGATLGSLAMSGEEDAARIFADELSRIRTWYLFEDHVVCTELGEGTERALSLFEALADYRAQSLSDEEFAFDFTEALDFQLDEYIVSFSSILEDDYGDGDTYGEYEDYRDMDDDD